MTAPVNVVNFGTSSNFANPVAATVDVGTAPNRVAYVKLGRLNSSTPLPVSVTVGSDSLTAIGSVFTDADGRKTQLFVGVLSVTGSQTVTGTYDDNAGFAYMEGSVWSGVDVATAVTIATSSLQTGTAGGTSVSFTVTSVTGNKVLALVNSDTAGGSLSATSPATQLTGTGLAANFMSGLETDGSLSTTIAGTYSSSTVWSGFAVSVPATGGGGGGSAKAGINYFYQRGNRNV